MTGPCLCSDPGCSRCFPRSPVAIAETAAAIPAEPTIEEVIRLVHERGARMHGALWLTANQELVERCWGTPINIADKPTKLALSRIALRLLSRARQAHLGEYFDNEKGWYKP